MTAMPEAKLAREAELPYASVAMVTDYDCWREESEAVEMGHILEVMAANAGKARDAGAPPRREPAAPSARPRPSTAPSTAPSSPPPPSAIPPWWKSSPPSSAAP